MFEFVSKTNTINDIVAYCNRKRQAPIDELNNGTFNSTLTSDILSKRANEDYLSVIVHDINTD